VGTAISIVEVLSSRGFVQPINGAVIVELLEETDVDEFQFGWREILLLAPLGKQKIAWRKSYSLLVSGVNLKSPNVKTIRLRVITSASGRFIMDLQIKLFSGLDRGNHIIIITRGSVDIEGFREIFRNVVNTTRSLLDCKVLIDLQDATYQLEPGDIRAFADNLRPEYWPSTNRVALVSEPDPQDYRQLCVLSTFLSNRDIKNAVFKDTIAAVSWLADTM
jgi:hypothetical protein